MCYVRSNNLINHLIISNTCLQCTFSSGSCSHFSTSFWRPFPPVSSLTQWVPLGPTAQQPSAAQLHLSCAGQQHQQLAKKSSHPFPGSWYGSSLGCSLAGCGFEGPQQKALGVASCSRQSCKSSCFTTEMQQAIVSTVQTPNLVTIKHSCLPNYSNLHSTLPYFARVKPRPHCNRSWLDLCCSALADCRAG